MAGRPNTGPLSTGRRSSRVALRFDSDALRWLRVTSATVRFRICAIVSKSSRCHTDSSQSLNCLSPRSFRPRAMQARAIARVFPIDRSIRLSRRHRLFALAALLGVAGLAKASTVSTSFGAGTAFEDDSTGLVWLDLTITSNESYDYVEANLAPGGIYAGWQYATPAELAQFFTDSDGGIVNNTLALSLMNDLGGPLVNVYNPENGFMRQSSIGLLDIPFDLGHAEYGYIAVDNFFGPSIDPGLQGSAVDYAGGPSFGSWLVQTPEPGLLPIMAFVSLGIVLRVRKSSRSGRPRPDPHQP